MNKIINSRNFAWFAAFFFIILHFYFRQVNYNNWTNILGWDVLSYYLYLPFNFIYNDPGMTDSSVIQHIFEVYKPSGTFYQAFQLPNGNLQPMYTIGMAFFFLPFFLIAHVWALLGGYPADGFSYPYQFMIGNGMMLYIVSGIFLIRKVLLKFFTDKVTLLVMILLLFGTNYFMEASTNESMPHAVLFACYAAILYLNILWHEKPTAKNSALLGLISGLTILARGSEVIVILIPLLWKVYNKETLKKKFAFVRENRKYFFRVIAFAMIFPLIQILYWKYTTGSFILNTYQNTEGFDWTSPHIMKVLFSYKKSWFLYTPMIILPLLGIWYMRKRAKEYFLPIALYTALNFYMLASWAAWWQGGTFGMRYFVESYAVLAIPFGFFLLKIKEQRKFIRWAIGVIAGFLLFLNLFQTWQFNNWILDGYAMTKEYYWRVFLKTSVTDEDKKYKEVIRDFGYTDTFSNPQDYYRKTIGYYDFDTINSTPFEKDFLDTSECYSAPNSCRITKDRPYSPTFKMPFFIITAKEHAWIRVTANYFPLHDLKESPASLVIQFNHRKFVNKYKAFDLEALPYKVKQWNRMQVDYLTPYPLSNSDVLSVYFWLRGDKDLLIDNVHIEAFDRKW